MIKILLNFGHKQISNNYLDICVLGTGCKLVCWCTINC